jgi:hypothetical protein
MYKIETLAMPKLAVPTTKASTLPAGTVRMKNHKYFMVKKTKNGKIWTKAPPSETRCHNYLKKKIETNMKEMEKGRNYRLRNRNQAIAVSYSQTLQKYPACHTGSTTKKR